MTQAQVAVRPRGIPSALVILLAILAALLLAAAVAQGALRLSHRSLLHGGSGIAGLTAREQAALSAARQETINIQTYRLKSFDSDFSAALAGMTPDKATEWAARKNDLKNGLVRIKSDSTGTVSGSGLVRMTGDTAVVLVSSDSQRVDSKGTVTTFAQNRFQVTMKLVKGKWLMDDLQSVSLS